MSSIRNIPYISLAYAGLLAAAGFVVLVSLSLRFNLHIADVPAFAGCSS